MLIVTISKNHDGIEDDCREAMCNCCGHHNCMHSPIFTSKQCAKLSIQFKSTFKHACDALAAMLNIDKKLKNENKDQNNLLPFYDRQIFWNFLSLMNLRNNHLFSFWGTIDAVVRHGSRVSSRFFDDSMYFGHSVSAKTMLNKTEAYYDNYKKQCLLRGQVQTNV